MIFYNIAKAQVGDRIAVRGHAYRVVHVYTAHNGGVAMEDSKGRGFALWRCAGGFEFEHSTNGTTFSTTIPLESVTTGN